MSIERGPGNWPIDEKLAYSECRRKLDKARKEAAHWRDNHKQAAAEIRRLRKLVGPEEEDPVMETSEGYVPVTRHEAVQIALHYKAVVEQLRSEIDRLNESRDQPPTS
jgi:hypothetical protein